MLFKGLLSALGLRDKPPIIRAVHSKPGTVIVRAEVELLTSQHVGERASTNLKNTERPISPDFKR
jgi:hypothetical protein